MKTLPFTYCASDFKQPQQSKNSWLTSPWPYLWKSLHLKQKVAYVMWCVNPNHRKHGQWIDHLNFNEYETIFLLKVVILMHVISFIRRKQKVGGMWHCFALWIGKEGLTFLKHIQIGIPYMWLKKNVFARACTNSINVAS